MTEASPCDYEYHTPMSFRPRNRCGAVACAACDRVDIAYNMQFEDFDEVYYCGRECSGFG